MSTYNTIQAKRYVNIQQISALLFRRCQGENNRREIAVDIKG